MKPALLPALALTALALVAGPLGAQDLGPPLDAASFDARTVGRTITYSVGGQPYGIEQYMPGQKVLWAFAEGQCKEGTWFQTGQFICFDYQDENGLQCWTFHERGPDLVARFRGQSQNEPLVGLSDSAEAMMCQGPDVGV